MAATLVVTVIFSHSSYTEEIENDIIEDLIPPAKDRIGECLNLD